MRAQLRVFCAILAVSGVSCVTLPARRQAASVKPPRQEDRRAAAIARAQVWQAGSVGKADLIAGPPGPGGFARNATVTCDYLDKKLSGLSPKFASRRPNGDELKVKYGGA